MLERISGTSVAVALLACVAAGAHAQTLTQAKLEAWLFSYGAAWEMRDADLAARIFTENATYREMPFEAPKA